MRLQTIAILAALALAGTAQAQSIWGAGGQSTGRPAIIAPQPQPPVGTALPQPAPIPAPQVQPKPTWSLDDVPSDPVATPPVHNTQEGEAHSRPPVVMGKEELRGLGLNPDSQKFLEQYAQGNNIFLPQEPPDMDEETASILPYPPVFVPQEPIENYFDFDDECPTKNCPEDE